MLKENQAMRIFSGFLALTLVAGADTPPQMEWARWQKASDSCTLQCSQAPSAVYFRSNPERLVVEYAPVRLPSSLPSPPTSLGAVRWKQQDLSHVVCEIPLPYRIPRKQVRVEGSQIEIKWNYQWEERLKLAPGLTWTRMERAENGRYLLWNELAVDPSQPGVSLEIGLAKERTDARERTTDMISRLGAVAGINGGYFNTAGGPLGVVFRSGKLVSPHVGRRPPRTTLGIMKDKRVEFDQVTAQKGQLSSRSGSNWSDVDLALGGGPLLLRRGQLALTTQEEELGPNGNDITRVCARTGVATTRDGRILLVTASGYRDNHLQGLRLEEFAGEFLRRGGQEAMNLDGGASTTMAVGDQVVSYGPAAPRGEKPVATALLVKAAGATQFPYRLQLRCTQSELVADGSTEVEVEVEGRDAQGRPLPDDTQVRLFAYRLGLAQDQVRLQNGRASLRIKSQTSPGEGLVRVECAGSRAEDEVKLNAGSPARLWTHMTPVVSSPGRFVVTAQVTDRWNNPVRGQSLEISDSERRQVSGSVGQVTFEVSRVPGSPATSVTIRCGEISSSLSLPAVPNAPVVPTPSPSPSPSPSATPTPEEETPP